MQSQIETLNRGWQVWALNIGIDGILDVLPLGQNDGAQMSKEYTDDLITYAYYGIDEKIASDETVEVSLRDLMKIQATLAELIQFFHQPLHYQSIENIENYFGTVKHKKAFSLLHKANYEVMRRMIPERVSDMISEGEFDSPEWPFYFELKDQN